jgi:hypothetical protein
MSEQRIAELERQVGELRHEIASLRHQEAPTPRWDKPQVRITHPVSRVEPPSAANCRRLSEIVLDCYPQFAPRADREGFDAQFRVAMQRLLHVGRREKLDLQHGWEFWTNDCRNWQQQHRVAQGVFVGPAALVAAIVACGDIPYAPLDRFPFDLGFGLVAHGGGCPSTDRWHDVLVTGRLLEPTPLDRPAVVQSPASVQQLAVGWRK